VAWAFSQAAVASTSDAGMDVPDVNNSPRLHDDVIRRSNFLSSWFLQILGRSVVARKDHTDNLFCWDSAVD